MMGLLHRAGGQLTPRAEDAEILVVNTCSFIDSAKQESVDTILEMVQHKIANGGRAQKLIVAGCLVERYRDEIRRNIPEVDAVVGTGELEAILEAAGLNRPTPAANTSPFAILTTAQIDRHASAVNQHSRPETDSPQLRNEATHLHSTGLASMNIGSFEEDGLRFEGDGLRFEGDGRHFEENGLRFEEDGFRFEENGLRFEENGLRFEEDGLRFEGDGLQPVHSASDQDRGFSPGGNGTTTSRPEGDLREQQGRFSREAWDGATAPLPTYLYSDETPRILTTPRASAYIKIAEGCDHPCSFCIIPQLRGKFRSRPLASIVAEAKSLIAQGVREITLIGQDTTCYGEDLPPSIPLALKGTNSALKGTGFSPSVGGYVERGASAPEGTPTDPQHPSTPYSLLSTTSSPLRRPELADLLDALAPLPGLKWLRFLYAYPNKITTRLLESIAKHDTVAKYLDVPLQHASVNVLKRMKRGGSGDRFLQIIDKARKTIPGLVLRTSFIVGFPGETDADFQELCDFIQAAQIDWLGVFSYSDEEGAKAFDLDAKVPRRTIESRRRKLMRLQQKISARNRSQWIGRELDILVEGEYEETDLLWQGRSLDQAPEIDGKVLINDFGPHETLVPGTFYRAEITESHDYDVVARIIE
jgi:ribosomal protein S12 methylthiotransferase